MKIRTPCMECGCEEFTEKTVNCDQMFRDEEFTVKADAMVCDHCGWFTMTDEQADNLSIITVDHYRACHRFLTSKEIVSRRKMLKMNQIKFADFLQVGVASVKRWERDSIQDRIYDDRIREKTRYIQQEPNAICIYTQAIVGMEILHSVYMNIITSEACLMIPYPLNNRVNLGSNIARFESRTNEEALFSNSSQWRKEHSNFDELTFTTSA